MEWISCNESLPMQKQRVLIYGGFQSLKYQAVGEFRSNGEKHGFYDTSDGCWFARVTHWMPLPEPPKN